MSRMFYEVILDSGETANKCTIAPLSSRSDFRITRVKGPNTFGPMASQILLHHEGKCLTEIKAALAQPIQGIATIDCVWRRLDGLVARIKGDLPALARIPEGFVTAYPRKSTLIDNDPDCGLATIEAIFVASALLDNWDVTLLSEYHFGREFVLLNQRRFVELGVLEARDDSKIPVQAQRRRDSLTRRRDRGKY